MAEHTLLEHRDLEIRLDARLANNLLAALEFPLRVEFPEEELDEETLEVSEAHTPGDHDTERHDEPHDDGIEAIVEDVLVQPLIDHLDKTHADTIHTDAAKAAKSGEKRYQVSVRSMAVTLMKAPKMMLGNPVELRDVALQVQAELKVGVRLWGKWRWKNTTTHLEFEGRKAKLLLQAQKSRLLVLPELENTDVVIKLAIWKWQLKCKFGVSSWINRQLAKRGPFKVVDFADIHGGGQILGKTPIIQIQSIADSRESLQIKADITWE